MSAPRPLSGVTRRWRLQAIRKRQDKNEKYQKRFLRQSWETPTLAAIVLHREGGAPRDLPRHTQERNIRVESGCLKASFVKLFPSAK